MNWDQLLQDYFADPLIDEVLINSCNTSLHIAGTSSVAKISPFTEVKTMLKACQQLAWSQNQRLDPLVPAAGGSLDVAIAGQTCHLRWHCLMPPISRDGPLLSLRRHRLSTLTLEHFADPSTCQVLLKLAKSSGPLFIAGPTGAGKTSLMIALLKLQSAQDRVAILEQLAELPKIEANWIRLRAQSHDLEGQGAWSLSQTFDELLRLRPDRIIVGELRQKDEVYALRRAWLAGHGSVWTTLHALGPQYLAARLADLTSESPHIWQQLLEEQNASLILLNRGKPKIRGIWQWEAAGLRQL